MKSTANDTEIRLKWPTAAAVKPAVQTRPTTRVSSVASTSRTERRPITRIRPTSTNEAMPAAAACSRSTPISS